MKEAAHNPSFLEIGLTTIIGQKRPLISHFNRSLYQLDSIYISQNIFCYEFLGYIKSVMPYWALIGTESTSCLHFKTSFCE